MEEPGLISVRTRVVLDTLVASITEAAAERVDLPLDAAVDDALARAHGDPSLVRMGYLARVLEVERFERARRPMPWLAEEFARRRVDGTSWGQAAGALANRLAESEPPGRPHPDDDTAVSWKVPGPGGHVRFYLALRAAGEGPARLPDAAKRGWLAGFLVHCISEAAPPESS